MLRSECETGFTGRMSQTMEVRTNVWDPTVDAIRPRICSAAPTIRQKETRFASSGPQTLHLSQHISNKTKRLLHGVTPWPRFNCAVCWPRCHRRPRRDWRQQAAGAFTSPPVSSSLQIYLGCTGEFSFYIHLHKKTKHNLHSVRNYFYSTSDSEQIHFWPLLWN